MFRISFSCSCSMCEHTLVTSNCSDCTFKVGVIDFSMLFFKRNSLIWSQALLYIHKILIHLRDFIISILKMGNGHAEKLSFRVFTSSVCRFGHTNLLFFRVLGVHTQVMGSPELSVSSTYSGIWFGMCSGKTYKTKV